LELAFSITPNVRAIESLMLKYHDVPMSLADACLVRMSELYPGADVLTLDSHFLVYRTLSRKGVPTVMPPRA
jgi:predicted nucleic acid-binding protein